MSFQENEERIRFLLKMSDAIRPVADPLLIQDLITSLAMEHFRSDRCFYADVEDDQVIIQRDASRGLPSIVGNYAVGNTPIFRSIVNEGKTITVADVRNSALFDESVRQLCIQLQIISLIDVPIVKGGVTVGKLSVVQSSPREWTPLEIELAEEVAERTWSAVERGKIEKALRQSDEKYRRLFNSIDEGFCVIEVLFDEKNHPYDYRFLEVNASFEKQTGLVEAKGKSMRTLAPEHEDHWFEIYGRVAQTGEPIRFEAEAAALKRWYDVYAFHTQGPSENEIAVLFKDITEQKRAEQALLKADRQKNKFLATLAHELRNPLTPITGALRIARQSNNTKDYRETYAIIERQVQNMIDLVNDLLDISRITQNKIHLKKERIDLTGPIDIALETVRPLMLAAKHKFSVHLPDEPIFIQADRTRIAQILINLLTNAVKYTDPGGSVQLSLAAEDKRAVIRVKDNGIGLAPDTLGHIFEMFHQVESDENRLQSGLGIGLSLVKELVSLHGGTVSAQSEGKGKGCEFICSLPIATVQETGQKAVPIPTAGTDTVLSRDLRILLVDDNEDAAIAIQLNLQLEGYTVETCFSGQSALKSAGDFQPDAAILDIGLPDITGYDLARRLRQQFPEILLIAHTGWGMEEDRRQSKAAGFDHHLVKPALVEELIAVLEEGR